MLPALLILTFVFVLLLVGRVGGARRVELVRRWPAVVLAGAAILAAARGALWPAIAFGALAVLTWVLWPRITSWRSAPHTSSPPDPDEVSARATLGVGPNATESDIRAAYRNKIARAHPDRGGSHNEAARLTAARDRLLKRKL